MTDPVRFADIFRLNIARRSRTAKGQDKGGETSSHKMPLLLQGEALAAMVAANTEALIADVLESRGGPADSMRPRWLRASCERWFDIVSAGTLDLAAYEPQFARLEGDAAKLSPILGVECRVNRRYRVWTPGYTTSKIEPVLIEHFMDDLYLDLSLQLAIAPGSERMAAMLMARADCAMDGEVHPWIDGCSRVSTALVMWISAYMDVTPPLFAPTKAEHYETIRDIEAHAEYFMRCFDRGDIQADAP